MKKLLIPLFFLLTFSTLAKADPFTQMLKGGLKGGLKSGTGRGNSYEKIMFNKNIGNYGSLTTVKVTKSYDSFYEKESCKFDLPYELKFYDELDDNYALIFQGHYMERLKPWLAFKFDRNPPVQLASMMYGQPPEKKVIPYSRWSKNKQLTVRKKNMDYIFNLKDLVKAIETYKKCKRSVDLTRIKNVKEALRSN